MILNESIKSAGAQNAPIISLLAFCRNAEISTITAWRFRKRGWLQTVNICGRQYVTADGIAEFTRRAAAGEFAQEHKAPRRGGAR